MPNKIFRSKFQKWGSCRWCNKPHGTGIWCFYVKFLDNDLSSTGSHLIVKWELLISEIKVWLDIEIFRDDYHDNESLWALQKDEYSLDDFSWTYRRHWDELVELTQNRSDGMMEHRYDESSRRLPNPKVMVIEWKCHVQERPATIKCSSLFPKFSPVIVD